MLCRSYYYRGLFLINWYGNMFRFLKHNIYSCCSVQLTKAKSMILPTSGRACGAWNGVDNYRKLVLDQVRHFQPIPIHRLFAVNRYRYGYDTDTVAPRYNAHQCNAHFARIRRGPKFYAWQLTDCLNGDWMQNPPADAAVKLKHSTAALPVIWVSPRPSSR